MHNLFVCPVPAQPTHLLRGRRSSLILKSFLSSILSSLPPFPSFHLITFIIFPRLVSLIACLFPFPLTYLFPFVPITHNQFFQTLPPFSHYSFLFIIYPSYQHLSTYYFVGVAVCLPVYLSMLNWCPCSFLFHNVVPTLAC